MWEARGGSAVSQRAENGGLDPSWLNLAFLGRPDFQSRGPKILIRGAESMVMNFHGNVRGEVRVNFLALFASKSHLFHVRCPQIVRNCSRKRSLEHCHSHAFLVPELILKGFGTSGRQSQPRRIQLPSLGPLSKKPNERRASRASCCCFNSSRLACNSRSSASAS